MDRTRTHTVAKLRFRIGSMLTTGVLIWAAAGSSPSADAAKDAPLTIAPGGSMALTQDVQAPFVPPKPDIVLVVDRTGSMGPAITNVKQKIAGVIATVRASEPTAQFAIAAYCDTGESVPSYQTVAPLSGDAASVIDAMIAMPLCYGGDLPEAQLDALYRVGGWGKSVAYRTQSQRIVAWFGDAPGHTRLRSEQAAIASLKAAHAHVVAVSVGRNQLDSTGQASRITQATGGTLISGISPDRVASAILEGITSLPVVVEATAACDPGVSIDFAQPSLTIPRGKTAAFAETITVAEDAVIGDSLGCRVRFTMDGVDLGPDYAQQVSVLVTEPADKPTEQPTDLPSQPGDPASSEPTDPSVPADPTSDPAQPEQTTATPVEPAGGQTDPQQSSGSTQAQPDPPADSSATDPAATP